MLSKAMNVARSLFKNSFDFISFTKYGWAGCFIKFGCIFFCPFYGFVIFLFILGAIFSLYFKTTNLNIHLKINGEKTWQSIHQVKLVYFFLFF